MSEERERNIAFSQSLKSALKLRGHGDCTDEESKFFTSGFIAGEKFASQVCEQREKEPRVDIKWLGEQLKKEAGIAIAYERGTRNPTGASDGTYAKLTVQNKRAEAAELALQTQTIEMIPLRLAVVKNEETIVLLQTALQAKEQELVRIAKQTEEQVAQHIKYGATDGCCCEPCESGRELLAQARQQAVADLESWLEHHKGCAAQYRMGGHGTCDCGLDQKLRSLTPPPALTPTCIGYEGGCDGNLTGEPHEANCPMFAPPALTKETK